MMETRERDTRDRAKAGAAGRPGMRRAVALVAATVGAVALACGGQQDPVAEREFRDLPADQVMFNLDMDIKDVGTRRARLNADTAHVWEDSSLIVMFPVDLTLYDPDGAETAHLTADEGEYTVGTQRMVARGNVVLVTTEGDRRILTEELHYDPRQNRIWSDVHTVMHDGESRLEGSGFRANDELTDIQVFESTGENVEIEF